MRSDSSPSAFAGLSALVAASLFTLVPNVGLAQEQSYYYCDASHAYFPYVQTCTSPWRSVPVPASPTQPKPLSGGPAGDGLIWCRPFSDVRISQEDCEHRAALSHAKAAEPAPAPKGPTPLDEIRESAKKDPNKTVLCGVNGASFWSTNGTCAALIEESVRLSSLKKSESRFSLVTDCAKDLAKKLPGKDEPTYLNSCEELVNTIE